MDDAALFEVTVPVFRHYTERVEAWLAGLPDGAEAALDRALAPRAFTAAEHLHTALGFVSRTIAPLLGRPVPEDAEPAADRDTLLERAREVRASLEALTPADFDGAAARTVRHVAGEAELEQTAVAYATLFALPNFLFHLSTAFAVLRLAGLDLGKADFDGQHAYAAGFHFRATPTVRPGGRSVRARSRTRPGRRPRSARSRGARRARAASASGRRSFAGCPWPRRARAPRAPRASRSGAS